MMMNPIGLFPSAYTPITGLAGMPQMINPNAVSNAVETSLVDVLRGNGEAIMCLAVSDNGVIVVAGCLDGRSFVWRTDLSENIKLYCELVGHQAYVRDCLIFYPQVLTASGDGTVMKWHLPTRQLVQTWRGHEGPITQMAMLKSLLFTAAVDETAILWDYNTGVPLLRFYGHSAPIGCMCLIPSNGIVSNRQRLGGPLMDDILVTGSADTTIRFWALDTGQTVQMLGYVLMPSVPNNANYYGQDPNNLQPVPDGTGHKAPVTALVYVKNTQLLCSGAMDNTIRGWMSPTWQCVIVIDTHSAPITQLELFDDELLYSAAADGNVHSWKFEMQFVGVSGQLMPVAHIQASYTPSGDGQLRANYKQPIFGTIQGSMLDGAPAGHPRNPMSFYGQNQAQNSRTPVDTVTSICKVGRFLCVGAMDGKFCCYDELGSIVRRLQGHTNAVTGIKALMDRFILSASTDGTVRVWNRNALVSPVRKPDVMAVSVMPQMPPIGIEQALPQMLSVGCSPEPTRKPNKVQRVTVVDSARASSNDLPDLRTIKTQTSSPPRKQKFKPKKAFKIVKNFSEEEEEEEEEEEVLIPLRLLNSKPSKKIVREKKKEPILNKSLLPLIQPSGFDSNFMAFSNQQRDVALMTLAAEAAVERALRRNDASLNNLEGRQSLPLNLASSKSEKSDSRAWSLPSAGQPRALSNAAKRMPTRGFDDDDDNEYFQELDYAPSQIIVRK